MKKKLTLLFALILLISLFAGCGSSKSDSASMETTMATSSSVSNNTSAAYGYAYDMEAPAAAEKSESVETTAAGGGIAQANVKMIYSADISLQTTEFDEATAKMSELVSSLGGYFEASSVDNYGSYRYGSYTIRVPAEHFESFCNQLSQLCQLNSISRSADDISEVYYDTEARLTTQRTKLERLQELLAQAESMEDIITLESAISETELAIENLTGTLRHYDSLVGYSTIRVSIDEVYKLEEVEEPVIGFGAKLASAFKRGCTRFVSNLQDMALSFAYHWVGWVLFLAVAAVVIVIAVRRVKARRRRFAPQDTPSPEKKNDK